MADMRRALRDWVWPAPTIIRRLWSVMLASAVYTSLVYLLRTSYFTEPLSWTDELAVINGLIAGVLIGFRTKTAYDRWWEGRNLWGALTNTSRNLCVKASALVNPPIEDRHELFHLVTGFPLALMRHLRGTTTLQLVPGFETDPAQPKHVPAELARRVFALIARWRQSGRIDGHAQQVLDPHAAALMDICGACEKIRTTPLPDSYLYLLRHGLVLSLLVVPWHLTHVLGVWAIPAFALVIYFMIGIEMIAEEVEQPFGFDPDDLPLERFCDTIHRNAAEILGLGKGEG